MNLQVRNVSFTQKKSEIETQIGKDFALKIDEIIINKKISVKIGNLLGRGGAGYVFCGTIEFPESYKKSHLPIRVRIACGVDNNFRITMNNRRKVVIKVYHCNRDSRVNHSCDNEAELFRKLSSKSCYFPEFFFYFQLKSHKVLVLEDCGENFEDLINPEKIFSWSTICDIVHQLIDQLEVIHKLGFLHKSVKPDNIVVVHPNTYFLVDFSRSSKYVPSKKSIVDGNFLFANRKAMVRGYEKRDDLYSVGLIIIYLANGCLPWDMKDLFTQHLINRSLLKKLLTKRQQLSIKRIEMEKRMRNVDFKRIIEDFPSDIKVLVNFLMLIKEDNEINYNFIRKILKEFLDRGINPFNKSKENFNIDRTKQRVIQTVKDIDNNFKSIVDIVEDVKRNSEIIKKIMDSCFSTISRQKEKIKIDRIIINNSK